MARRLIQPATALTCGWCMSGLCSRCAKPKHGLPCACFDNDHKEA